MSSCCEHKHELWHCLIFANEPRYSNLYPCLLNWLSPWLCSKHLHMRLNRRIVAHAAYLCFYEQQLLRNRCRNLYQSWSPFYPFNIYAYINICIYGYSQKVMKPKLTIDEMMACEKFDALKWEYIYRNLPDKMILLLMVCWTPNGPDGLGNDGVNSDSFSPMALSSDRLSLNMPRSKKATKVN